MTRRLVTIVTALLLSTGCSAKIPDKYKALGIPPTPDGIAEINTESSEEYPGDLISGPTTDFYIEYKTLVPRDVLNMHRKIDQAGYKKANHAGNEFKRPDGAFYMSCTFSDSARKEPARCLLRIPKE